MGYTLAQHQESQLCAYERQVDADAAYEVAIEKAFTELDDAMGECTTPAELADLFAELLEHGLTGSLDNKAVRAREWAMDELRQFLTGWTDKNREIVAKWAGVES